MIKTVELNDKIVRYYLERKDVKNINLRIKPDMSVRVSANFLVSDKTIEDFLKLKANYILNALNYYSELKRYEQKPKEFIDGETFRLLGHEYRLKILEDKSNIVEIDGAFILLHIKDKNNFGMRKRTMDNWVKKVCEKTLKSVCDEAYLRFQKYGIDYPELRFRNMVSRWGSCQPKRKVLTFNIALIEMPISCVEYVVVHEFTHFLYPNHSKMFYQSLATFMPDWKERKRILDNNYSIL